MKKKKLIEEISDQNEVIRHLEDNINRLNDKVEVLEFQRDYPYGLKLEMSTKPYYFPDRTVVHHPCADAKCILKFINEDNKLDSIECPFAYCYARIYGTGLIVVSDELSTKKYDFDRQAKCFIQISEDVNKLECTKDNKPTKTKKTTKRK